MKKLNKFQIEMSNELLSNHANASPEGTIDLVCRQWGASLDSQQVNSLLNIWAKFHGGLLDQAAAFRLFVKTI